MDYFHAPALLGECIAALNIKPDGLYVDCTLGGGGHSEEICKRLTTGRLIALDRDGDAIEAATERLDKYKCFRAIRANFSELGDILSDKPDGILFDLGVSSYQLDNEGRGFSYRADAPLDMRMDKSQNRTAAEYIADASRQELCAALRDYGEERFASKIADEIVRRREAAPITTTFQLRDAIVAAIPEAAARKERQHPAKRSFMAVRIAVNGELDAVRSGVAAAVRLLVPNGRLAVLTWHSIEDRLVKQLVAEAASGCDCPKDFPVCVCGKTPAMRQITKKPVIASEAELEANPRAKSAKLRVAEKI